MIRPDGISTIFVSQKNGDDRSTGFLKENTLENGPLKTIERALEKVKELRRAGYEQPLTIKILDEKYTVTKPIENNIAILGDKEKYIAPAVIEKRIVNDDTLSIVLKYGCKLSFYAETEPVITINGKAAKAIKDDDMYIADCSDISGSAIVTVTV